MPEGPEVKFYVDSLQPYIDKEVNHVSVNSGRYAHSPIEITSTPFKIINIDCYGKFIYFETDKGFIWNTLGITGGWSNKFVPYARLEFSFSGSEKIYFFDQRNFGTFKFNMSKSETDKKIKGLGIDFLKRSYKIQDTHDILRMKRNLYKTLPEVLMNQKNYAGVGNYIKSEVLYRCKLSPHRTVDSLTDSEIILLHQSIDHIINSSYNSKHKKFSNVKDCGEEFKKLVYKKKQDPLGYNVVSEETKDKRTSYWVPEVQK